MYKASLTLFAVCACSATAQITIEVATISAGGVVTSDGSIVVVGQPIAGLACSPPGPATFCLHAGFVPAAVPPGGCEGDADGSGLVGFADITRVLENWGIMYPGATGPGDANFDGEVNFADVTSVLNNWNAVCP